MPPNNPGYDVESRDENGELVRLIEVKSFEGAWGKQGAILTKNEFETAQACAELFWLYVVEFATSDDPILHPIQNPGGLANQFLFDNGWMGLEESNRSSASQSIENNLLVA
jgi:hypothetical protein